MFFKISVVICLNILIFFVYNIWIILHRRF